MVRSRVTLTTRVRVSCRPRLLAKRTVMSASSTSAGRRLLTLAERQQDLARRGAEDEGREARGIAVEDQLDRLTHHH
jgi:hypothetical protein